MNASEIPKQQSDDEAAPNGEGAARSVVDAPLSVQPSASLVEAVALDIAKWFVNGDRPDEWKLKEWAEKLDRDAIDKAYEWRKGSA